MDTIHHKESILKQNSRNRWIRLCDLNRRFFHNAVKERIRRNLLLTMVNQQGIRLEGVEEVRVEIASYFESKFNEDFVDRPLFLKVWNLNN